MFEIFEAYITAKANFTPEEIKLLRSLSTVKKLRRRQLLLQEGEVCRYKIFVAKGLLKMSNVKNDGTEYVMRFAPEYTWTTDFDSYTNQTPSKYNIEALEETEVVLWTPENLHTLFDAIPSFRSYSEDLISKSLFASHERILMNISCTSEEKYQSFINSFPDVFNRVPLHLVASYLGVSRETLSRIRREQLK